MAKLSDYIASPEVKPIFRGRYSANGYFVTWANQLLEELQERGFLSPYRKEVGRIVSNKRWLTYPSDFVALEKIYSPLDLTQTYRVEDINGKLRLLDFAFDYDNTSFDTLSAFTSPTVSSVTVDLSDKAKDEYSDYLFYVTAGNLAGLGVILVGNDASVTTTTKLNFMHDVDAAFGTGDVTAAQLIPPEYYVIMKYQGMITQLTTVDDEMPIPDDCEARLIPTWLRWCCEREAQAVSKETVYWQQEKDKILYNVQVKRTGRINPAKGRRLVGMELHLNQDKKHPDFPSAWPV